MDGVSSGDDIVMVNSVREVLGGWERVLRLIYI